ncbi:hypothetical protein [Paenibacillus sp. GCM10012306]|uniref:hypothetical protein n=1 Tax=Paenibacillus sp. GCM10012306 TaxID=3317342 RepID=UPI0036206E21
MSAFDYQNSTITKYRVGTSSDPYIDITESKKVFNGVLQLNEIPVALNKVRISGYFEVPTSENNNLAVNEYRVDYNEGLVYFHSSAEGKSLTAIYKGRGNHYVSSARVWTVEQDGNVKQTLKDFVDKSNEKIIEIDGKIAESKIATDKANAAATNANDKANLANNAATAANTATAQANAARDAANNAATNANTKADLANTAATAANIAKANADNAAAGAILAANTANTATAQANAARDAANEAKTNADTATRGANTARDAANLAATNANTAKTNADTAATNANTARDKANLAATNADTKALYATQQGDYAKSAGDSLVHKGDYSASTAYFVRNLVYYSGSTYMCVLNTTAGTVPTNTTYWRKIVAFNWKGIYSIATTYQYGDFVVDSSNQKLFMCVKDGTLNIPITTAANWNLIVDVSESISNANTATTNATNAATNANTAATNANTARDKANLAATNADTARDNANIATGSANAARDKANIAATNADAATTNVNAAITNANSVASRTTFMGDYSTTITYYPNNIVAYGGSSYMCTVQALNKIPTNTGFWRLLAKKGQDGNGFGTLTEDQFILSKDEPNVANPFFWLEDLSDSALQYIGLIIANASTKKGEAEIYFEEDEQK